LAQGISLTSFRLDCTPMVSFRNGASLFVVHPKSWTPVIVKYYSGCQHICVKDNCGHFLAYFARRSQEVAQLIPVYSSRHSKGSPVREIGLIW
jgi:hypothetical protein